MKFTLALATIAASMAVVAPARAAADDVAAQLDALVAPHFPANGPGAAVLVRRGDQILLRKGYGSANLELDVPMRPELVFRLGSITKQFTSAAIMMLVDQGKLALGDDVRKYVPEYPSHGPTVTIEQLLSHTGGVPNYTEQPAFHKRGRDDLSHAELLATFKDLPLDFAPGTQWKYSNSGYYLLGMVIEKVTGKSWAAFLGERIFTPLGMTHTRQGDVAPIIPGRVAGYDRADDGFDNSEYLSMTGPFAAGALVSTVDDLARWDRAIGDGKLLKKASWARVFSARRLPDGSSTHYGFGWGISAVQGHPAVWHNGGIPGFSTAIVRVPDQRLVAIVLCNSSPALTNPDELAFRLAATALGKPFIEPKPIALAPAALDRYVGVYKVSDRARLVVRRDGDHLTLQRTGRGLLALDAETDGRFFVKDTLVRVAFVRDAHGRVTGLDMTEEGAVDHRARTDEPLPAERIAVAVDGKILEGYVGRYELGPGFVITVTREGAHLFAQATGQPRFELFASAPAEFFLKVVDAQVSFHAGGSGHAAELVLHQGGRDMPAKRLP